MSFVIENNILKGVEIPIDEDCKLGPLVYDALNESPDHVAQIDADTGEQTTIREMKDRSVRCAVWMQKLGITPQDIVVVVTHNHLDSYIPVFATFFVDAIFSAWYQNLTLRTARRFMKKFRPKLIFTCEKAVDVLREAATLENLSVELVVFGKNSDVRSLNDILDSQTNEEVNEFKVVNERNPQEVAAIMLSSGTTGLPKGVMLTSRTLLDVEAKQTKSSGIAHIFLWYATPDWVSCIVFILKTLLRRNTRVISGELELESFFRIIEKYKVTVAALPTALVRLIAKSKSAQKYDLRSLRFMMNTGSKHSESIIRALQKNLPKTFIYEVYASTECARISFTTPESKNIESAGLVGPNCQIKIVDLSSGEALGPNRTGEIQVKTPNIMIGYYEDPEATSQAFDEEGWYRTGDIGYYNENCEVFVVDRIKEVVKCRSYQVSLKEIEDILLSHPEVEEAAVVAIPHELDDNWPVAFVKPVTGSQVTVDELMIVTSVLEDNKKLRGGIYFMDNLPRTGSGKLAKCQLKELAISYSTGLCHAASEE